MLNKPINDQAMIKEPRTEIIAVRVTIEEKQKIKKKCRELGHDSISECIRKILEEKKMLFSSKS